MKKFLLVFAIAAMAFTACTEEACVPDSDVCCYADELLDMDPQRLPVCRCKIPCGKYELGVCVCGQCVYW